MPANLLELLAEMAADRARERPSLPQLTVTRSQAATALSMSQDHFERHVAPHIRLVRSGRLVLVPIGELKQWVEREAAIALDLSPLP